jgi:hypothetical protein
MTILQHSPAPVHSTDPEAPYEPTPAEWASYCESTRGSAIDPPSDRSTYLPAAQWFAAQAAWMRSLSHEVDDFFGLIADALVDLQIALNRAKTSTARGLIEGRFPGYAHVDLDAVAIPDERHTHLADLFDEQAAYYLSLNTDLGRLAAWAILQQAEGAEFHGANTVQEYLDADAAFFEAEQTVYDDFGPMW